MAKKIFKRWLPDPAEFKKRPALNFMSHLLHDPNLFHLNRHSVSGAFFIGLFTAFLPILGQMPIAALLALVCRVNLPIAVALVWISNPITIPPIFFATYELGRWILDTPSVGFSIELSWEWFSTEFTKLWRPLVVGSLICGVVFGGIGYISIQLFWRWHVVRNWEKRKRRRAQSVD
ncbi:MAG: ATP-binding protein [Cellvibrionaceae bacterium]|nr:ATP-binding protein [Cellvibrionaceae bacterium]|tara:strand:+ start:128495 stop:129022 length:528 start_codon:yes stop_codon:yes gene_type:complete